MVVSRKIELKCMLEEESFDLFQQYVGEETLNSHPLIRGCAENVARECGGLPLALIVIGRAMVGKHTLREWEHALQVLKDFPSKLCEGMEDDLFYNLKFSYDSLSNASIKSCFLYCTLFPEDTNIKIDDLVKLWIGEGFLDEFGEKAYDQGHMLVETLKRVGLLENGDELQCVKMHDVIRDMGLWIACDCGQKENKYLVRMYGRYEVVDIDYFSNLQRAERVSLWHGRTIKVTKMHEFPKLTTFFVKNNLSYQHPRDLFQFMPVIKVLDLSGNAMVREVPVGVDNLVSLEYLNLSWTKVSKLPSDFIKLVRLRYLGLDGLSGLNIKPQQLLNFPKLQVLDMWRCGTDFIVSEEEEMEKLVILENLEDLISTKLTITRVHSLQKIESSTKLQSISRGIYIWSCSGLTSCLFLNRIKHLEELQIAICFGLKELRFGIANYLHSVHIWFCPSLKHLNCLTEASSLQHLEIRQCESLEEVISEDGHGIEVSFEQESNFSVFSQLQILKLDDLPKLRSICSQVLVFPSLKTITVSECPLLKKLPLDSNSVGNNLKQITGMLDWWNGLQWDNEYTKHVFSPYFHDICRRI